MKLAKALFGICVLLVSLVLLVSQSIRHNHIEVFEAGNISTEAVEYGTSFSESGTELYFARSHDAWGSGAMKSFIYFSKQEEGNWSAPQIVSFSGQYDDSDPHLAKDGNSLFFISQRPSSPTVPLSADIWVVDKDSLGMWGTPYRMHEPINSVYREYSPCTDKFGNLYFASDRTGGFGQGDLYQAQLDNGSYNNPINLGRAINSSTGEWNLEVNEAGTLIIFEASQREQNISSYGDLYISFLSDGIWSIPQHLVELNTSGSELNPHLAQQEKFLFFSSSDSLNSPVTNLYYTDFSSINQKYKQTAIFVK
ncbi:MAG: hypothetical protein AAF587_16585 [Bacteroidota bacterium]